MSISGISGINSYYYLWQSQQCGSSSSANLSTLLNMLEEGGSTNGGVVMSGTDGSLANSVMGSQTDTTSLVSLLQDAAQLDAATGTTTSADELFSKIADGGSSISESQFEAYVSSLDGQSGSTASSSSGTSSSDTSAIDQLFNAIDTSGDGSISKSEFESFESKIESAMSAPPPPPMDSTASLDSLLQSLGTDGTTDSTTGSTTTSAAASSTSSTSDQTNSASAFMALLMEAISSYMQFGQTTAAAAGTLSVTA